MSPPKFDVLIVGSGIGGLSAAISCRLKGFNVTCLEWTDEFKQVGAGVFLAANASRVLLEWGLKEAMEKCSIQQRRTAFLDQQGVTLKVDDYELVQKQLVFPLWQMHRADLHAVLLARAQELGVEIQMGRTVKQYDWEAPAAVLEDGTTLKADVIIAADGYRSYARQNMLGCPDEPRPSGNSALRALIPTKPLHEYPELKPFYRWEDKATHVWIGEGRHVVGYPVREGKFFNIVLTQKAIQAVGPSYVVGMSSAEVQELYKDWDPNLRKILGHLPDPVLEWRLCDMEPMDSWVFPGGKICLLGDACHTMLPSAAQGAAMSIEDGAAIAELLARATDNSGIPRILKTYQKLRLPRCADIISNARKDAKKWQGGDSKLKPAVTSMWSWDYNVIEAARNVELEA